MPGQYYYLVSGLPDILLDSGRSVPSSIEVMEELEEILSPDDLELLGVIRLQIDNRNLINILETRSDPFDPRGKFSRKTTEEIAKGTEQGPDYMDDFLQARQEGRVLFAGLTAEDTLAWLYHEEMEDHPNEFIREWAGFEADLRNILGALNARADGIDLSRVVVGRSEAGEAILKSSAADLSLGQTHPWIEKLIAASADGLLKREKIADQLRWDKLGDLTILSHFGIETLLAFILRLFIAERWVKLDPAEGRRMLDELAQEMASHLTEWTPAVK